MMDRWRAWQVLVDGVLATPHGTRRLVARHAEPPGAHFVGLDDQSAFADYFTTDARGTIAAALPGWPVTRYVTILADAIDQAGWAAAGYRLDAVETLMVRDLALPLPAPPALPIEWVTDPDVAAWCGAHDPLGERWIAPLATADATLRHAVLRVDGLPASRGRITRLTPDAGFVTSVATAPALRRRGLADALMRGMLHDEAQRGARWSVLQAAPGAAGVYARLGYRALSPTWVLVAP
ncbi:MAG: GNAT family N-acetyltransferase [Chloroflexi bacterium]|nr:GNAT family N-acetyltransferase [Chloroflexota bacterium]